MSNSLEDGILSRSNILIIDGDKDVLDRLERYLLLGATRKVHTATSPLLALRVIQDTKAAVDCIICANKSGKLAAIEFLENLRQGRWSNRLRKVPLILLLNRLDENVVQQADGLGANGYLIGELDRDTVIDTVTKVLAHGEAEGPLARFPLAHVRVGGADMLLIPLAEDFAALANAQQQAVMEKLQAAATTARLGGAIIPVWMTSADTIGFVAPADFHSALGALTADFIRVNINRRLSMPRDIGVSSGAARGQPFYAATAEAGAASFGVGAGAGAATAPGASASGSDTGGGSPRAKGPGSRAETGTDPMSRPMGPEDVTKVIAAFKQLGPEKFLKAFMRQQAVTRLTPGKALPILTEYYFSLDALRQALYREVDMRGSSNMFGELTLALDQAILRSVKYLPNVSTPFSLNLNVQTVFTKPFEGFLEEAPTDRLTIEFRQPNIVEFYDEYVIARTMLENKGIRIAVDGILPDTLGLVNLEYIGAYMAKVHWGEGAKEGFEARSKALKRILDEKVEIVLTRVDEKNAISLGNALGIERFQGRLVDDLVNRSAA